MSETRRTGEAAATPLRAFFVEMLVKDVSLNAAVLDLVDNCIDGATALRDNADLDGLSVKLTISRDKFVIEDNCGGITIDKAKNYAFKFGHDPRSRLTTGGVGLFGVGMKRAIFKLGKKFEVKSTTELEKFQVSVDVPTWLGDTSDKWTFPMTEYTYTSPTPPESRGTIITVHNLYEGISAQFGSPLFVSRLMKEIASRHDSFLRRHIAIKINNQFIAGSEVTFKYLRDQLAPIYLEYQTDGVKCRIISGIGESDPMLAGWYVYCNGRMVVKADQSELTGWGQLGMPAGGMKMPKFHHQFARFRGCAYFESDDQRKLPWKTTKDGVDVELPLFQNAQLQMIATARPVIDFLNKLDRELADPNEDNRTLTFLVTHAPSVFPTELPKSNTFTYVQPSPRPKPPQTTRITFDRPKEQVERMKKCLGVDSNKRVGESVFDWYLENECRDE